MDGIFRFGKNQASCQREEIPFDRLFGGQAPHVHVMGTTGSGKSKLLELMAREIIDAGYGLCLLDGKRDLYEALESYCADRRIQTRTILIDPNDKDWSVGINYLELIGDSTAEAWAEKVLEGLKKVFGEAGDYKPWYEEWAPAALAPLIEQGYTLLEVLHFMSIHDPRFRDAVLSQLNEDEAAHYRFAFTELSQFPERDQAAMTNVVRTRAKKFWQNPVVRSMLGQRKTAVDWRSVMDRGAVVLARAHRTPKVSKATASMLGVIILHQIMETAYQRPSGGKAKPFFVLADEFQNFACPDFAEALAELRSFGVVCILSHQQLDQLRNRNWPNPELLCNAVRDLAGNKIYFRVGSGDAEELVPDIFPQELVEGTEEVKDQIETVFFRPVKTYEEIVTEIDSENWSSTRASGSSNASGQGIVRQPDGLLLPGVEVSQSRSDTSSQSESSAHSRGGGSGTTRTVVPFYDLQEDTQVTSRTYYGLAEVLQRFRTLLQVQEQRRAVFKLGGRQAFPMVIRRLPAVELLRRTLSRFRTAVYSRYALPADQVLEEIASRVPRILEEYHLQRALVARTEQEALEVRERSDEEDEAPPVSFTVPHPR